MVVVNVTATPQLTAVLSLDGRAVVGLTSLDDVHLYVLHSPSNQRIEVYDTSTFKLQRSLDVADLSDDMNNGMTSCRANNCLYVNDYNGDVVFRVDVSGNKTVLSWEVGGNPMGISTNAACNVLVTCHWTKKLQEYTPNGSLIREISVQWMPLHAIELKNGHFLVSLPVRRPVQHDIVELDSEGRTIVSYSEELQHSSGQLFMFARHLTVDKNEECVYVASWGNDRLIVVNRRSWRARLIHASADGGKILRKPCCLYLDESSGRLYAGEEGAAGGRLFLFDIRHHCPCV